ncbi:universal stress protein [Jidongwangia harbinensis]|uniref:universal stress protein n=1 Tax=Jidongwangia harbinensis TaxID=2878561 RepID=UPI001CDA2840|nr:universal stress protein [Jidongwangia harbinensis]MCA2218859.1 universal stress protein [Jidongwangia harbinensis]
MFTTIAWATDGSASATEALPIAEGLARATGGKLVIIHVQEITIGRSGFLAEDNSAVLASLHHTVRRLRDDGFHATLLSSETTTRNVPRKILDLAGTAHADVLVIGSRRHGSVVKLLLGSVANRLLQASSMPIITVPSRSAAATPPVRSDDTIRRDIEDRVPDRTRWMEQGQVRASVSEGVVTLTGSVGRRTTGAIAVRLVSEIPGVMSVVDNLDHDFADKGGKR